MFLKLNVMAGIYCYIQVHPKVEPASSVVNTVAESSLVLDGMLRNGSYQVMAAYAYSLVSELNVPNERVSTILQHMKYHNILKERQV